MRRGLGEIGGRRRKKKEREREERKIEEKR